MPSLKFKRNGEVRRVAISNDQISFTAVKALATNLYKESQPINSNIIFKYYDEEKDLISVHSDAELAEAIGSFPNCLTLFIHETPHTDESIIIEREFHLIDEENAPEQTEKQEETELWTQAKQWYQEIKNSEQSNGLQTLLNNMFASEEQTKEQQNESVDYFAKIVDAFFNIGGPEAVATILPYLSKARQQAEALAGAAKEHATNAADSAKQSVQTENIQTVLHNINEQLCALFVSAKENEELKQFVENVNRQFTTVCTNAQVFYNEQKEKVCPNATVIPPSSNSDDLEHVATFVCDVTVPDGETFYPNVEFTKTWRLVNSGTTTWPAGCKFILQTREKNYVKLVTNTEYSLPQLKPKEIFDLSIPMKAPSISGTFTNYFRVVAPNGSSFGDRFWVQIVVNSVEQVWHEQLQQLAAMGFTDRERCVKALTKNGGELTFTVADLLRG